MEGFLKLLDIAKLKDLGSTRQAIQLFNDSNVLFYLFKEEEEVIGYLILKFNNQYASVDIVDVFIVENYRGRYVLKAVVQFLIKLLDDTGFKQLNFNTHILPERFVEFYTKDKGYKHTSMTIHTFIKEEK